MGQALCPNGHQSEATDYCDQCGAKIDGAPSTEAPVEPAEASTPAPAAGTVACPACAAPNVEGDKFCESCGYDMVLGPPAPGAAPTGQTSSASWQVVVVADRVHYDRIHGEGIPFPAVYPDRVFALTTRSTIGRKSVSRGINPEIDLTGAPEDPGVSHLHTVLVGSPSEGWKIIDPGSSNGTYLNDSPDPIPNNAEIPVGEGDRIHIGAWTTVTLRKVT